MWQIFSPSSSVRGPWPIRARSSPMLYRSVLARAARRPSRSPSRSAAARSRPRRTRCPSSTRRTAGTRTTTRCSRSPATGSAASRWTSTSRRSTRAGSRSSGVTVTSAFGSYRGGQVIPPFFTDYDLLKFEGDRANEVRDVRVEIRDLDQIDYPEMEEAIKYERFDDGLPVGDDETFDAIELTNTERRRAGGQGGADVVGRAARVRSAAVRVGDPARRRLHRARQRHARWSSCRRGSPTSMW